MPEAPRNSTATSRRPRGTSPSPSASANPAGGRRRCQKRRSRRKTNPPGSGDGSQDMTVFVFLDAARAALTRNDCSDASRQISTATAQEGYVSFVQSVAEHQIRSGGFNPEIAGHGDRLRGPLEIVDGTGPYYIKQPDQCRLTSGPVTGTNISRRAAGSATDVARACESPMTALYVANTGANAKREGGSRERRQEQAILKRLSSWPIATKSRGTGRARRGGADTRTSWRGQGRRLMT